MSLSMQYGRSGQNKNENCQAESTKVDIDLFGFDWVNQALYKSDLAPMDFKVIPTVKLNNIVENLKELTKNTMRQL